MRPTWQACAALFTIVKFNSLFKGGKMFRGRSILLKSDAVVLATPVIDKRFFVSGQLYLKIILIPVNSIINSISYDHIHKSGNPYILKFHHIINIILLYFLFLIYCFDVVITRKLLYCCSLYARGLH